MRDRRTGENVLNGGGAGGGGVGVGGGFFFFNDTATTEIYTLSLHDALPIWHSMALMASNPPPEALIEVFS